MKKLDKTLFRKHLSSVGVSVEAVLKKYPTAIYVGQFPLRAKDDRFTDWCTDVFYEKNPKRELGHGNYFAVYTRGTDVMITGADHIEKLILLAYNDKEGDMIYSRYQHDFRSFESESGCVSIDGGWWMKQDNGFYGMCTRFIGDTFTPGISVRVIDGEFYKL